MNAPSRFRNPRPRQSAYQELLYSLPLDGNAPTALPTHKVKWLIYALINAETRVTSLQAELADLISRGRREGVHGAVGSGSPDGQDSSPLPAAGSTPVPRPDCSTCLDTGVHAETHRPQPCPDGCNDHQGEIA